MPIRAGLCWLAFLCDLRRKRRGGRQAGSTATSLVHIRSRALQFNALGRRIAPDQVGVCPPLLVLDPVLPDDVPDQRPRYGRHRVLMHGVCLANRVANLLQRRPERHHDFGTARHLLDHYRWRAHHGYQCDQVFDREAKARCPRVKWCKPPQAARGGVRGSGTGAAQDAEGPGCGWPRRVRLPERAVHAACRGFWRHELAKRGRWRHRVSAHRCLTGPRRPWPDSRG